MAADEFRAKYARDLNCLADEDRAKRRRALATFTSAFAGTLAPPAAAFFLSDLLPALLRVVSDPVEKNREMSLTLITDVLAKNQEIMPTAASLALPVLSERVGVLPFPEPAEEVRLLAVKLIKVILSARNCVDVINDGFETVSDALVKAATDTFHDVKVGRLSYIPPCTPIVL